MSLKCRVLHGTPCYVSRLNLQEPERMVLAKKTWFGESLLAWSEIR